MSSLYGPLSGNVVERADYVPEEFYSHPAIKNMEAARRKLELIQTLTDEVIGVIPETPTKSAAVMQLHTASMWLDKALSQGYSALRSAFAEMETQKKRLKAQEAFQQADPNVGAAGPDVATPAPAASRRPAKA